jgi:hypothetical protein
MVSINDIYNLNIYIWCLLFFTRNVHTYIYMGIWWYMYNTCWKTHSILESSPFFGELQVVDVI